METTKKAKTMTINRKVKRDRHPARSARILTTGIAISATLGISSALTLAAQASANSETVNTPSIDPTLSAALPTAPTSPAPATPAVTAVPVAPQVIDVPVPAAPQGGWTAPATSGSN
jgi:hypothetical protein